MRLMQAMAGAKSGGAELQFVRLVVAMERAGVAQRVLIRRDAARAATLRAQGVEPVELGFGGVFDVATRPAFRREIAAFRPDIVLTYMSRATRFCPTGDFVHVARLGGYYDLKYYRRCDHLIGNTPDIVEHLVARGWPRERAHLITNLVVDRTAAARPRVELDTPADAPLILALGRLHPNKAFDTLLAAMADVPDAHLWLAGEGALRPQLERQAAQLGLADRLRFLGWVDDPAPLFAAADMLVVPSRHEPLGNVILEGWMHRVPIVATASQGASHLIRDGVSGLLVPVDDAPAMAAAIRRLIADPELAQRLVEAGRGAYEAEHTEAAVVGRYLDLFEHLLAAQTR